MTGLSQKTNITIRNDYVLQNACLKALCFRNGEFLDYSKMTGKLGGSSANKEMVIERKNGVKLIKEIPMMIYGESCFQSRTYE